MGIAFTQYLRPNARQVKVLIDRPAEIEALAEAFIAKGGRFTVESLLTGAVSFTAEWIGEEDEPLAHEVVPNGPQVPIAVDRLVRKATVRSRGRRAHAEDASG